MHNHFERAGDRRSWVTERETNAFFAVVNCKDAHSPPILSHRDTLEQHRDMCESQRILKESLRVSTAPWQNFKFTASPLKYGMARSVPTATRMEKVIYGVNSPVEDFSPNETGLHLMHIPELVVSLEQGPRTE